MRFPKQRPVLRISATDDGELEKLFELEDFEQSACRHRGVHSSSRPENGSGTHVIQASTKSWLVLTDKVKQYPRRAGDMSFSWCATIAVVALAAEDVFLCHFVVPAVPFSLFLPLSPGAC